MHPRFGAIRGLRPRDTLEGMNNFTFETLEDRRHLSAVADVAKSDEA